MRWIRSRGRGRHLSQCLPRVSIYERPRRSSRNVLHLASEPESETAVFESPVFSRVCMQPQVTDINLSHYIQGCQFIGTRT